MIEYILFSSIATICLFFLAFMVRFSLLKEVRRDNLRYKLYVVRDELIRLVATKELVEEDFVFKEFYIMINTSIKLIDRFTVGEIIRASREHKHTLEQQEVIDRLVSDLENKNDTVKAVINKFFVTMIEILIIKSLSLRIRIKLIKTKTKTIGIVHDLLNRLSQLLPERQLEPYRAYEFYQNSQHRLGLV